MAERLISDYDLGTPAGDDKIIFMTGGGVTYYTTWDDIYHYGNIRGYSASATPGCPSVAGTYVAYAKRTSSPVTTPVAGPYNGITLDVTSTTSARLIVATAGVYKLAGLISFKMGSGTNQIIQWTWHKNGTALDTEGCTSLRLLASSSDVGNCSPSGEVSLSASDYLDLRVRNATASPTTVTINIYSMSMNVTRIGP